MSASRARESALWEWLNKFKDPRLDMHRVENVVERGYPDVEGCWNAACFIIELKSVPRRPRAPVWCELRSDQALFLRHRWACGGSAWVLVQVGMGAQAERYLVPGDKAQRLLEPIEESALAALSVNNLLDRGPKGVLWQVSGR